MYFVDVDGMPYRRKRDRVYMKSLTGERAQLAFIRLEAGESTDHVHPGEQIGYVVSGAVEVTVGGWRKVLRGGDGYVIPSNVRHGFRVVSNEPVEYLEVLSPPREETGYEPTGYEATGYEPTGYQPTGYPPAGHQPTGHQPTGYEPPYQPR